MSKLSVWLMAVAAPAALAQCGLDGALSSIVTIASETSSLSTLVAAVGAADSAVLESLSNDGTFTVFAPTDDAFAALGQPAIDALLADPAQLTRLLLKHVLGSEVPASTALELTNAAQTTLSGEAIRVDGSTGSVLVSPTLVGGAALVTRADIFACNGVVHVIDKVIALNEQLHPVVTARKDPHLHFAHGGKADLRGEDGSIYNFLSAHNVSMNVKTVKADFHWKEQLVHGTRIGAVYWTLKAPDGSLITVKYESTEESVPKNAYVAVDGKSTFKVSLNEAFTHQDVRISLTGEGLKVSNTRWAMTAKPGHFPYAKSNKKKYLLDIQAMPLYDADSDLVSPHGIFGQSFDGDAVAVDGARDKETEGVQDAAGRVVERTTAAQAEGAIEGALNDYKMGDMFATNFKFSRFEGVPAPPRDVSKLKGNKRTATNGVKPTVSAVHIPADDANKTAA